MPELIFALSETAEGTAVAITEITWVGLRCRITVAPPGSGLSVDLRTKANAPATSISPPKALGSDGRVSLVVENEGLEGTSASVVVLDPADRVLTKQATTVGGDH